MSMGGLRLTTQPILAAAWKTALANKEDRTLPDENARSTPMEGRPQPSWRNLAGIALILLLIAVWATFVASLARIIGTWSVLAQAPFYLIMGVAWIIPLSPFVRWMQTGSFRVQAPRD